MRRPIISLNSVAAAAIFATVTLLGAISHADCPSAETMRELVAKMQLERASRTAAYGYPVPDELIAKALEKVGKPYSKREGIRVDGVMVAPVAAEKIWRAINDEVHHAEGYLPVKFSEVVEGQPRGVDRVLFQYYKKAGIGRWWASRVEINSKMFKATEGQIWELTWRDWMDEVDRSKPPIRDIAGDIRPIVESRGSWMLVPLAEECTLLEHFSWSEPGGALGVLQALVAAGAIRDTLKGITTMAQEHHCSVDEAQPFHGADGQPIKP